MHSPSVMNAVLQLSAEFSGLAVSPAGLRGAGASYLMAVSIEPIKQSPLSILGIVTHFVLLRVKQFVQTVPEAWTATFHGGRIPRDLTRDDFADESHRQIWQGSFALMARLGRAPSSLISLPLRKSADAIPQRKEIAQALMFETAPSISSDLFRELLLPSDNAMIEHVDSSKILSTSLHCLALLGDVMTLCLAPSDKNDMSSGRRPHRERDILRPDEWTALLSQLWEWYKTRPVQMQSLAEINHDHEASFPTILLATPVGISVNMSYHAAMFLLLSHWPADMPLEDCFNVVEIDQAQMSPGYHVRRVCGIALNSDPEHTKCWDPCAIAAFSLAARSITLSSQRNEILSCFDQVRKAGWRIDGLVRRLQNEWT